jgi:hypothetical protein
MAICLMPKIHLMLFILDSLQPRIKNRGSIGNQGAEQQRLAVTYGPEKENKVNTEAYCLISK